MEGLSFSGQYTPVEKTFSTVGPILGKEAIQKSLLSIILVILAIVLFIAFAFRKVSRPISSWIYGLVTILARCTTSWYLRVYLLSSGISMDLKLTLCL